MRSASRKLFSSLRALSCCSGAMLLLYLTVNADPAHRPTMIVARDDISVAHRNELAEELAQITGWTDLRFDSTGVLQAGGPQASGSPTARELVSKALIGNALIVLEDASDRQDVVFCSVVPGRWKNPNKRIPVYVVLIDFADFNRLTGDQQALAAFNAGWAFLHEIDHVVNDSVDPQQHNHAGECEDHINQMRRESNLPERADYFYALFPNTELSTFSTHLVRLPFYKKSATSNKTERYWLIWDASLVGGLGQT